MITETGRVVAVEPDSLWVETIRKSACESCSGQKGCGHGLLNKVGAGRCHQVRVLLGAYRAEDFQLNDEVEIAIPERVLVQGALLVYLLPLLLLALAAILAESWFGGDVAAVLGAGLGLLLGLLLVRLHAHFNRNNQHLQPQLIKRSDAVIAQPLMVDAAVVK